MWPFTKKYGLEESGIMRGLTDWHSHVLPGVDDGIRTIDESLKVLAQYESLGVDTLWLTPHIMEDTPNQPDDLRRAYDEFLKAYQGSVKVKLAAENMLDNLYDDRLAAKNILPIGDSGTHLLVETSYFTPPTGFDFKLQNTFSAGYFPLLAHPERYVYMDTDQYDELHQMGVRMQLNLPALFGAYGRDAQKKAEYLLDAGYYNAIGFDIHRYSQICRAIEAGMLSKKRLAQLQLIPGID